MIGEIILLIIYQHTIKQRHWHTYTASGVYTIVINGYIEGFRFAIYNGGDSYTNTGDRLKITNIAQWGDLRVGNEVGTFYGTTNMDVSATDAPDLNGTSSLEHMFDKSGLGSSGNFNSWDTSLITDMHAMFKGATSFNHLIDSWNISSVTNISTMFQSTSLNQDISSWDVSHVTNMQYLFWKANKFNQDISSWNVSSVTKMTAIFRDAANFNQSVNNWDVSSVTDMNAVFRGATKFNQPLNNWNVSSVTDMTDMFLDVTLSIYNYDAILNSWSKLNLQQNITFNGGNSKYSIYSETARNKLINDFGWIITDASLLIDNTKPIIDQPEDMKLEGKIDNTNIIWNVSDKNHAVYNVTIDNVEFLTNIFWTNGSISIPTGSLSLGIYNFTIYVYDLVGNVVNDSVIIKVIDTTIPIIDYPVDLELEGKVDSTAVIWTVGDTNPATYNVTKDGVLFTPSTSWSNGSITISTGSLSVGTYNFTIYAYDQAGGVVYDSVIITVMDTTNPTIDHPENQEFEGKIDSTDITWIVGDLNPSIYNVTKDGELFVPSTSWTNGSITISTGFLSVGTYNFTIYIFDQYGNIISDSVIITITEVLSTTSTHTTHKNSSSSNTSNGLSGFDIALIIASILSMGSASFYFIRKRGYF